MSLAVVHSRAMCGLEAIAVNVEVHIAAGMPNLHIVGLPEKAVQESKYRVRAVIAQSGFEFPLRRITVNLAPADLPKEGGRFDLPIALGILAASEQLPLAALARYEFLAELGLDGRLRSVRGILPAALATAKRQRALVIAHGNAFEASLVKHAKVYRADALLEVCRHLSGGDDLRSVEPAEMSDGHVLGEDLADVRGQYHAVRALEVAAAGRPSLFADRLAGQRQDDAGEPSAGDSAAAERRGSTAGYGDSFLMLGTAGNEASIPPAVPHAPSLRFRGGACRRWFQSQAGRDHQGA